MKWFDPCNNLTDQDGKIPGLEPQLCKQRLKFIAELENTSGMDSHVTVKLAELAPWSPSQETSLKAHHKGSYTSRTKSKRAKSESKQNSSQVVSRSTDRPLSAHASHLPTFLAAFNTVGMLIQKLISSTKESPPTLASGLPGDRRVQPKTTAAQDWVRLRRRHESLAESQQRQ